VEFGFRVAQLPSGGGGERINKVEGKRDRKRKAGVVLQEPKQESDRPQRKKEPGINGR